MRSKVQSVIFKKQGQSEKYGPFYVFDVLFENNDTGQFLAKSQDQKDFVAGVEAEYTLEPNGNYPARIKPVRQAGGKFPQANPQNNFKICALTCATNLVAAKIITENQMKKTYKEFLTWLNE